MRGPLDDLADIRPSGDEETQSLYSGGRLCNQTLDKKALQNTFL